MAKPVADLARIAAVVSETWPGAEERESAGFLCRRGLNGGRRASAGTPLRAVTAEDLKTAATTMRAWGQRPMVAVRSDQPDLLALLKSENWQDHDHSVYFIGPTAAVASERPPRVSTFAVWEPLAIMIDLWAENDIPKERIAVMRRATCAKTTIMGRVDDRAAGCVYVGAYDGIAMVHSLAIAPEHRRKGLATHMMREAAIWAQSQGCEEIALLVGRDNHGAHALYASLGMRAVGTYHYRSTE